MALSSGDRVGAYEIVAAIGAGGMGEVYRARDTRLNRDVALKLLPEAFATDPDRVARFEREARTLASLNHPNIAQIYDVGATGTPYLAMELVTGEDLAEPLRRGPIAVPDALALALQMTVALEAAHDLGIVHRDLKPANVKVRDDGTVKILDFGLAKAMDGNTTSSDATVTSPAVTAMGVIIGTAAYMAPEQARGRPVDRRADIWAFGCVLYEMLTGQRAFDPSRVSGSRRATPRGDADSVMDVIAAVLNAEIRWEDLPPTLPAGVRRLIDRCLAKDPKRRLQSIGDARLELEDAIAGHDAVVATMTPGAHASRQSTIPWAITGLTIAALAAVLAWAAPWRSAEPAPVVKLTAEIGADTSMVSTGSPVVLSPDGKTMAFAASVADGSTHLFVRPLNALQATRLDGTQGASDPFFSPRGDWIGFIADLSLKKIRTSGGPSATLARGVNSARGAAWLDDETIVLEPQAVGGTRLVRVPVSGSGQPTPVGEFADGEVTQRWPHVLPDGKGILYTGHTNVDNFDDATLMVMPLAGGAPKTIHKGGYYGQYVRSGHILFVRAGTLFAMPFDLQTLAVRGEPVPFEEGVTTSTSTGGAFYSVSNEGILVYVPGSNISGAVPLSWVSRSGTVTPAATAPLDWLSLEIAPNGKQAAIQVTDGAQHDIVILDFELDTTRRLTTAPTDETSPVWSADSRFVAYSSTNNAMPGKAKLLVQRADGIGQPMLVLDSEKPVWPGGFNSDGTRLVYTLANRAAPLDMDLMDMALDRSEPNAFKPGVPRVFRKTEGGEGVGRLSPDGKWIAYVSDEGAPGAFNIFVESYPEPGGRWQVSQNDGVWPVWSRAKPELLYLQAKGGIMSVPYTIEGGSFRAGRPAPWSGAPVFPRSPLHSFSVHPDGERVAGFVLDASKMPARKTVRFVFNLFEELRRIGNR